MLKKVAIFFGLLAFSFSMLGCETAKGLARGTSVGVCATTKGITQGIAKDTLNFWQAIIKADNWIKKNLW